MPETRESEITAAQAADCLLNPQVLHAIYQRSTSEPGVTNPFVYLDVVIGGKPKGRVVIELYQDVCPKTVANFTSLCLGDKTNKLNQKLHYKGVHVHSVVPGWYVVGGDITNNNGTGGESIYGKFFPDENFNLKHDRPGRVSMLNFKNNTNNSQFIITLRPAPSMDCQYPVFGQVVAGMDVIHKIEGAGTPDGRPLEPVIIGDCGVLPQSTAQNFVREEPK